MYDDQKLRWADEPEMTVVSFTKGLHVRQADVTVQTTGLVPPSQMHLSPFYSDLRTVCICQPLQCAETVERMEIHLRTAQVSM